MLPISVARTLKKSPIWSNRDLVVITFDKFTEVTKRWADDQFVTFPDERSADKWQNGVKSHRDIRNLKKHFVHGGSMKESVEEAAKGKPFIVSFEKFTTEMKEWLPQSMSYSDKKSAQKYVVKLRGKKHIRKIKISTAKSVKEDKLRVAIRSIVEQEIEEMNTTGGVSGFNVPGAFSDDEEKKGKKKKGVHGGSVATSEGGNSGDVFDYTVVEGSLSGTRTKKSMGVRQWLIEENRWLELKRNEELSPAQKIGRGVRGINRQLKEVEDFVRWYARLQTEQDVSTDVHWKRTHRNVRRIKERIIRIANSIKEIQ